jgi:hypothetical protein
MAISDWYSDEELISELRMFIDEYIDLETLLGQITEVDEQTFELKYNGRTFQFDREVCGVEEV